MIFKVTIKGNIGKERKTDDRIGKRNQYRSSIIFQKKALKTDNWTKLNRKNCYIFENLIIGCFVAEQFFLVIQLSF